MDLKDIILELVNKGQGIKGPELATEVCIRCIEGNDIIGDYRPLLEQLVKDCEIVEIEYVLPSMTDRTKSIFFPKGTEILGR
jgi:hypothetical protein